MYTGDIEPIQKFFNFLVQEKAIEQYLHAVASDLHDPNMYSIRTIIVTSFSWSSTLRSFEYWATLSISWSNYCVTEEVEDIPIILRDLYAILQQFWIESTTATTTQSYTYW